MAITPNVAANPTNPAIESDADTPGPAAPGAVTPVPAPAPPPTNVDPLALTPCPPLAPVSMLKNVAPIAGPRPSCVRHRES